MLISEDILKIKNIDKLNENDIIKLNSIHSSIGSDDSFDSWFENSISSKKIPKALSLVYLFMYIVLVFFMGAPLFLTLIPLTVIYLIPISMILFIDSLTSKIPFLFFISIKWKLWLPSIKIKNK